MRKSIYKTVAALLCAMLCAAFSLGCGGDNNKSETIEAKYTLHSAMLFPLCEVSANEEHEIKIEYFQAGGEASCVLCAKEVQSETGKCVYLPAGIHGVAHAAHRALCS